MKRLVIRERVVPGASAVYDEAWAQLVALVRAAGGRAWRFRQVADPHRFVEFLESEAGQDLADSPGVAAALEELAIILPCELESIWEEWPG